MIASFVERYIFLLTAPVHLRIHFFQTLGMVHYGTNHKCDCLCPKNKMISIEPTPANSTPAGRRWAIKANQRHDTHVCVCYVLTIIVLQSILTESRTGIIPTWFEITASAVSIGTWIKESNNSSGRPFVHIHFCCMSNDCTCTHHCQRLSECTH